MREIRWVEERVDVEVDNRASRRKLKKTHKKAHWKVLYKDNEYDTHFECSNCGRKYRIMDSQLESLGFENYCGNCGCTMVEGKQDEEKV